MHSNFLLNKTYKIAFCPVYHSLLEVELELEPGVLTPGLFTELYILEVKEKTTMHAFPSSFPQCYCDHVVNAIILLLDTNLKFQALNFVAIT